jgi:hypothetical protein
MKGYSTIVTSLIQANADVNIPDNGSYTALIFGI